MRRHRGPHAPAAASLEGCVWQGFLPHLRSFEWADAEEPPDGTLAAVALRATLWASAHPWPVLGITTAVTLLAWFLAGQATGRLAAGLPPRAAACWLRLVREQRGSFSGEIGGQSPVPSGPSAVLLA